MSDDPEPSGRRSRRAKAKVIDYAKEQEFSDEDLFEDVSKKDPAVVAAAAAAATATPKKKRTKGNRKSKGNGRKSSSKKHQQQDHDNMTSMDPFEDDFVDDYVPSKPIYTEKGYDTTLPPIRERFPFLPEYELDGSPRIDLIVGRRPVDEKNDKKNGGKENSSDDDDDNDNENNETAENDEDESDGRQRQGRGGNDKGNKRGKKSSANNKKNNKKESSNEFVEYEYLVKYKNLSYMHLEWKSGADLESMNKSAKTIYRRYLKKVILGENEELEDPNFDPSFVVVQKVLAEEEQELELEVEGEELVKWEKDREKELAEDDLSEEREKEEEDTKKDNGEKVEAKVEIEASADKKDEQTEEVQMNKEDQEKKVQSSEEEKKGEFSQFHGSHNILLY